MHPPTSFHSHRTHSHCSQFGKYSTTSLKVLEIQTWILIVFYSHHTNSQCLFELVRSSENIPLYAQVLQRISDPSIPLYWTFKSIFASCWKVLLQKCMKLNLCWWRQKMVGDNCSKLLGILQNIATYPAFRRWIVPSPSNNLLRKKNSFCFIISVSNIDITISCILAGQLSLQNSFKL